MQKKTKTKTRDLAASGTGEDDLQARPPASTIREDESIKDEAEIDRIIDEHAAQVMDPNYPHYQEHVLGWYVRMQIKASPLTPAEIAEKSGVSVSQIYRFVKGERSLTLESADKILPVVGRSLVEAIRRHQDGPSSPEAIAGEIEDEKDRLRQRLDEWEKGAIADVKAILEDVGRVAAKVRKVLDEF